MGLQRRTLLIIGIAVAAWYGWRALGISTSEMVTLHAPGAGTEEHYTRVWIVDDPPFLWVRADRPTRRWLPAVRTRPRVQIVRRGDRAWYRAEIRDDPETVAYVDALFQRKYGLADTARRILTQRDPIPIQLLRQ